MTDDPLSTVKGIAWALPISIALWCVILVVVAGVF